MMSKALLSVAMCTYNGSRYLHEQLASIAGQSRLPDELIVCDDRSTDGTVAIVREFASKVPFPVRLVINDENLGSTKNFEKAIGMCSGDIIFLSDQDDVWLPEKLGRIERIFDNASVGAVFSDAEIVDQRLMPLGYRLWQSVGFTAAKRTAFKRGDYLGSLIKRNIVTGATMAFRASYRDVALPIPSGWVHDGWIALVIAALSDIAIIEDPLILYRQHPGQQIGTNDHWKLLRHWSGETLRSLTRHAEYSENTHRNNLIKAGQYRSAYDRLLASGLAVREGALSQLDQKVRHVETRERINGQKRIFRLPAVLREMSSRHYHHYSYGMYSVLADIFL